MIEGLNMEAMCVSMEVAVWRTAVCGGSGRSA